MTGLTGFIGSAIIPELIQRGHQVLGLTRSDAGAARLQAAGAEPHRGDIEDPESLQRGAGQTDHVIHTAFDHDFAKFKASCEKERRAIETLGGALKGSDRPLVLTSGVGIGSAGSGQLATEDHFDAHHPTPRIASEEAGAALTAAGVNVTVVRLLQVHDPVKQGLITIMIDIARAKGVSAYVNAGENRLAAAHVSDVARLYVLALERRESGARYHAVVEEGVPVRAIAEVVGRGLQVPVVSITPEEAGAHFGWFAMFAGLDLAASSAQTQARLHWHPTGPGLIADLEAINYAV